MSHYSEYVASQQPRIGPQIMITEVNEAVGTDTPLFCNSDSDTVMTPKGNHTNKSMNSGIPAVNSIHNQMAPRDMIAKSLDDSLFG